jgi:pimeloyl-ACP methyl ester carboxylesterase
MITARVACCMLLPLAVVGEIPNAPGQLIDIGGTRLHLNCSGKGSPVVILEAGFPGSSLDWTLVQPGVAEFTRVCSYDRAGFGWSEKGKEPRSASQIAEDLKILLLNAQVSGPYILVGHSMGGLYTRAFVRKSPESVTGMVLVDATHEDQWDFEPKRYWDPTGNAAIRTREPEVQRPAAAAEILKEMWATEQWKAGERAEREAIKYTIADAQREPKRLPVIPLIVLSAGVEIGWSERVSAGALKGQQLQREMAAYSALGIWRPVAGANHYLHLSQPAAVIDAVRQVFQATRAFSAVSPPRR